MRGVINLIYWLQAFVSPVILAGLAGIAFGKNIETVYVCLGIGAIAGIVLAEYIRKK
ncbi:MAG: hypothetical protein JNM88_04295 [Chitinophagaceae bacterium]|nr:hypothetical protein [Chitinophagaceae bacterium]